MIRLDVISEVVDVVDRQDEQVNLAVADVETVTLNVCDNDRVYLTAQDPDILETKVLGVGYLVTANPYEGPYRVTPSNQQQTLPTQNKSLIENIIVEAVDVIQTETKTATPSQQTQTITPTPGKYLASVVINPIPNTYGLITQIGNSIAVT